MKAKKCLCIILAAITFLFVFPAFADSVPLAAWNQMDDDWIEFPVCKRNRTRSANYAVQRVLRAYNVDMKNDIDDNGGCDGAIGPITEECIRDFQRAKGLSDDGVVGENTWNAMFYSHYRGFAIATSTEYRLRLYCVGYGQYIETVYQKISNGSWYAQKNSGSYVEYFS